MAAIGWRDVDTTEAIRLVAEGAVHVVDVRSPEEYRDLGHVPGAILLPVDLIVSGAATLPRDGRPLLVHCEHGIRSVHACDVLARAGIEGLLNLRGGLSVWTVRASSGPTGRPWPGPPRGCWNAPTCCPPAAAARSTSPAGAGVTPCCWPRRASTCTRSIATRTRSRRWTRPRGGWACR